MTCCSRGTWSEPIIVLDHQARMPATRTVTPAPSLLPAGGHHRLGYLRSMAADGAPLQAQHAALDLPTRSRHLNVFQANPAYRNKFLTIQNQPYNLCGFEKGQDRTMPFLMKKQPCRRVERTRAAPLFFPVPPTDPQLFLKALFPGAFCAGKTFIDVKGNADDDQSAL